MHELKNLQKSYVSWQWRMMQNLKRNWLVVSKLTWGIWQILTWAVKSLKNLHFNGLLLNKVYNVWAKKVQRSYVSWHWRVMQNLKKTDLWFWKMAWVIRQIFTRALESLKIWRKTWLVLSKVTWGMWQISRPVAVRKLYFTLEINK